LPEESAGVKDKPFRTNVFSMNVPMKARAQKNGGEAWIPCVFAGLNGPARGVKVGGA